MRRDPREEKTIKMERFLSSDLNRTTRSTRSLLERSGFMKTLLKIVGVLGVSLVMSGMVWLGFRRINLMFIIDGVLTPAQSVLGAIQG